MRPERGKDNTMRNYEIPQQMKDDMRTIRDWLDGIMDRYDGHKPDGDTWIWDTSDECDTLMAHMDDSPTTKYWYYRIKKFIESHIDDARNNIVP